VAAEGLGRWVGIDEAGYGPNLGPLVMASVTAEGPANRPPALWDDLATTVARAGDPGNRLWVDDSKAVYRAGLGLDRLEAGAIAATVASGRGSPTTVGEWLAALGSGSLAEVELRPHWLPGDADPAVPSPGSKARVEAALAARPFVGAPWRIVDVRAVVVGPALFNSRLAATGSKAHVHFEAFARLLRAAWDATGPETITVVNSDKHGGRHYYLGPLTGAFPELWIDRGPEGPDLSRYLLRGDDRRLTLTLRPRADAGNGLVALASMIAKAVRERWMEAFNACWVARVPGLRPSAGYPTDARRFREAIGPEAQRLGLDPSLWWRDR